MSTWELIKRWYIAHGFPHAAENMREIKEQWEGNEQRLLARLVRK